MQVETVVDLGASPVTVSLSVDGDLVGVLSLRDAAGAIAELVERESAVCVVSRVGERVLVDEFRRAMPAHVPSTASYEGEPAAVVAEPVARPVVEELVAVPPGARPVGRGSRRAPRPGRSVVAVVVAAVVLAVGGATGARAFMSSGHVDAEPVSELVWADPLPVAPGARAGVVAWSASVPDGSTVLLAGDWVVVTGDRRVRFLSAETGRRVGKPVLLAENPSLVAPVVVDGRPVVVVRAGSELVLWASGRVTRVAVPLGADVSTDGGRLLIVDEQGASTIVDGRREAVASVAGGEPVALTDSGLVEVLPPGRVATSAGVVALMGPAGSSVGRWLAAGPDWVAVTWSSASRSVLAIHDVRAGKAVSAVEISSEVAESARWVRSADRSVAAFGSFVVAVAAREISVNAGGGAVFTGAVPGAAIGTLDGASLTVRPDGRTVTASGAVVGETPTGVLARSGNTLTMRKAGNE